MHVWCAFNSAPDLNVIDSHPVHAGRELCIAVPGGPCANILQRGIAKIYPALEEDNSDDTVKKKAKISEPLKPKAYYNRHDAYFHLLPSSLNRYW